jgi:SUKH superfamily protein
VNQQTIDLIERVRRRLVEKKADFTLAGPQTEANVAAAEEALGISFPPSYRTFLRKFGHVAFPTHLGIVHDFVGIDAKAPGNGVVERTVNGRSENRLRDNLVVVGLGANYSEWFCIDVNRAGSDGEAPIFLFDAQLNEIDQQFYDSFEEMVREVLSFVEENLE